MTRLRPHFLAISLFVTLVLSVAHAQTVTKELARGVTLTQTVVSALGGSNSQTPQIINVLKIDPRAPGVRVQAVLAQDRVFGKDATKGRETVSSIAKRLGALVAVNADFFPYTGDALNLHISGGELISEPNPNRVAFGMTSDGLFLFDKLDFDGRLTLDSGRWFPIRGINRPREMHQLVAYTDKFFESTLTTGGGSEAIIKCEPLPVRIGVPVKGIVLETRSQAGDSPILPNTVVLSGLGTGQKFIDEHLKPGTEFTMVFDLKPSRTTRWEKVVEAVGGGPWLVRDGKVYIDAVEEGFQPGFHQKPHPRTAIGATKDGRLVLVTVDGRQSISGGMTLAQLARLMLSEGCVEAINLDGGGSSTLATSWGVLNSPSDGSERPVANAIAVFGEVTQNEVPEFVISPDPRGFPAGETVQLALVDSEGKALKEDFAKQALWSADGMPGFVDQRGRFTAFRLRKGTITAKIGNRVASIPVEVTPGPPAKVNAKLEPERTEAPNRSTLAVSITDRLGNAVPGVRISLKVVGGTADDQSAITAKDGTASVGITWDGASGGSVTVGVEGLSAQTIARSQ